MRHPHRGEPGGMLARVGMDRRLGETGNVPQCQFGTLSRAFQATALIAPGVGFERHATGVGELEVGSDASGAEGAVAAHRRSATIVVEEVEPDSPGLGPRLYH